MPSNLAGNMELESLVIRLFDVHAVKFGSFTLKSGIESPVYFDLRVIVSYPELMKNVADLLWRAADNSEPYSTVCGVPYTALPIATCLSVDHNIPMLIRRKEAKDYGTKKMIEGCFKEGDFCLIVEDVVTSGTSVMETVKSLHDVGVQCRDAVVLLDREQGGKERLKEHGINLHSVCTVTQILDILEKAKKLDEETCSSVRKFVKENYFSPKDVTRNVKESNGDAPVIKKCKKTLTYKERSELCSHPLSRKLFEIMEMKKTNLAFSVDVTSAQEVLKLADQIGPHICILKTHVDILEDFTEEFVQQITTIAEKHNFLIFEDRKFADIGNTVKHQYNGGIYKISSWADIINAHLVPGPGIIQGLKEVVGTKERGCVVIAQMSSKDNLITDTYTKEAVKIAKEYQDFILGFICTSKLTDDPQFIHMTPGISRSCQNGDILGQQYLTPEEVISNRGCDVIIVGRGILKAEEPLAMTKKYQEAGYAAYMSMLGS